MSERKLHILRRTTQILFVLLIIFAPVLDIFRFDSDTRSLIVFGMEWSLGLQEGFYTQHSLEGASHVAWKFFTHVLLPWIAVLAVFPLLGALTGRFFCGWFCPDGAIFELFDFFTTKIFGRRNLFTKKPNDTGEYSSRRILYALFALICIIAIPLFTGVILTSYLVDPATVWHQVLTWDFTFGVKAGIIGVSIYMFVTGFILRHNFCKYVCGAGLMQMLFGWISPVSLRIKVDPVKLAACTDCKGCERVCFMNVRPRLPKKDINCVNCGECIEACNRELGPGHGVFSFAQSRSCNMPPNETIKKEEDVLLNNEKPIRSECYEKTCH